MLRYILAIAALLIGLSSGAFAEDCAVLGQKVASDQAGELSSATASTKNGRPICVVVVVVPGHNGEKARRVEVAVPN